MENSLGSAIQKIKQQEQNKEVQLKAKREFETTKAAVERSMRDTMSQIKKYQQEQVELLKKTDELRSKVTIQKIRRDALAAQHAASTKELEELQNKADLALRKVQELRNSYCQAVHETADKYDVWALLMKPTTTTVTEPIPRTVKKPAEIDNETTIAIEKRLKIAAERRDKAIAERKRLLAEPDVGEEFVRIKNALRYSLQMAANLRK